MNTRAIPRTGELLPTVGLGTWQTFDVGSDQRAPIDDVLRAVPRGGREGSDVPDHRQRAKLASAVG